MIGSNLDNIFAFILKAVHSTHEFHRLFCVRAVSKFGHSFITYRMEVKKIFQAILSGKSREEVYNMLSPEERDKLNSLAAANGINRQQRRKLECDAKKGLHRRTA